MNPARNGGVHFYHSQAKSYRLISESRRIINGKILSYMNMYI